MKFIKLLWFDLRRGLLQNPLIFGIPVALALVACIDLVNRAAGLNSYLGTKTQAGFWDFIMYIYGGMDKYILNAGNPMMTPIRWAIVFLSIGFLTLNYPFKDMQTYGQQILIRTKGRTAWWLSKCGWGMFTVLVYHGLIFLTAALFCLVTRGDFTGGFHKALIYAVFQVEQGNMAVGTTVWTAAITILPVFVSLGMNLAQMALSLFIKPIFSFLATGFLMISSAYFTSPYMIGNYAMALRYDLVITEGVHVEAGWILAAALTLAAIVAGCIRFRRYDILNRD